MRLIGSACALALVACGSSPHELTPVAPGPDVLAARAAPPVAPEPAAPQPPAAPVVAKYAIIASGRRAGSVVITTAPDGKAIHFVEDVVENGRGPHTDADLVLGSDGTPASWHATGHYTMQTPVDESFSRDGMHARWKSTIEQGTGAATDPSFYYPSAAAPIEAWLVPAALRARGTLDLWPAGKVHVTKVADAVVAGRALVGYEISGLDLVPDYTWFNPDGSWFGTTYPWQSIVPEGWEKAIAPLVARQTELDRARAAQLVGATAHKPPAAGLAYTHARVLDVERGKWVADQTVVVVGDQITAVGASAHAKVPAGAEVVDLAGKALIPGLVDMHAHIDEQGAILDIASGVTTARDVGNDPDQLDEMMARWDAGTQVGPHLVRMGFIEGRNPKAASSVVTAETPDEAHAAVEFFAKRHYDGIKIYNSVPVALVPLLAADAHKRGMLVTGHIPVHMLAHEAVEAGYDGIEHINMLFLNFLATHETDTRDITRFTLVGDGAADFDLTAKPMRDFIAQLAAKKIVIDPTLNVFVGMYLGVPGKVTPGNEAMVERLPPVYRRGYLGDGLPITPERQATFARSWTKILALVKALWVAHVPVVAGTDSLGGVALHRELELLAQAGIPNADVMRLATVGSARAMRQEKVFGTIAVGKRADLVVLEGDPLADIAAVRHVVTTMRGGVVFPAAPLLAAVSVLP